MSESFSLEAVVRPNILALKPYRCARDDYSSGILLDANENSLGSAVTGDYVSVAQAQALNRYPDPLHVQVKDRLVKLRNLPGPDHVFLGVGSDEVIDLLVRIFCVPGKDKILITPPTYGMYGVTAQINDVGVVKVPLTVTEPMFQLNTAQILETTRQDPTIKMIFVCSPGNPTGTLIDPDAIRHLLQSLDAFRGIVVVDEAYIDFVASDRGESVASWVTQYPNLVVLQTMSKSFGLAGIRLGLGIAQPAIIQLMNNTKAPYNVGTPTAAIALAALTDEGIAKMQSSAVQLRAQRDLLLKELPKITGVGELVGTHDANFVLCRILAKDGSGEPSSERAHAVYERMAQQCGLVVRFRGNEPGCAGCLRITVGTPEENQKLLLLLAQTLEQL
ncbi:histidinol-phosphate transaminase [Dispira parvispora]|uniref:histidinol-phosphate transaminase n=1 Tax=Dispira parvispora TaxID=1520584 RepID=A0A9W8ARK5_9FUNG|nr:histidinol-phosphate transaminase [Dispira parvispora]